MMLFSEEIEDIELRKTMFTCYEWKDHGLFRVTGTLQKGKKCVVLEEKMMGIDTGKYKEKYLYEMQIIVRGKDIRDNVIQAVSWNPKTRQVNYSIQHPKSRTMFEKMTLRDELTEEL